MLYCLYDINYGKFSKGVKLLYFLDQVGYCHQVKPVTVRYKSTLIGRKARIAKFKTKYVLVIHILLILRLFSNASW